MPRTELEENPNPNPHYGDGLYRRRIQLSADNNCVRAELEDDCHGFKLEVQHNGTHVTDVSGETLRIPLSTCPGALTPLRNLIGIALATPAPTIVGQVNPRSNCTHLYDLALLAMAHPAWDVPERTYDVEFDDMPREGGPARAEVFLNGTSIIRWQLDWTNIVEPSELKGKPVLQGFSAWANDHFEGREKEAAFVLSKGVFVGLSRTYDMTNIGGESAMDHSPMLGVCHSYSPGVVESAIRNHNSVRDFTHTPEQLLKFV
jgi:hypothetical protein